MRAPQVVGLPAVPGPDSALSCVLLRSASGGPRGFSQSYRWDRSPASLPRYSVFDRSSTEAGAGFDRWLQEGVAVGVSSNEEERVQGIKRVGASGVVSP